MENHRVESVRIAADFKKVFGYISNPMNLPKWTHAFKEASDTRATLVTPGGSLEIGLKTQSSAESGTIDWHMAMPDGKIASAFSRVIRESPGHCVFSFVLLAPPVPLEALEGTLNEQAVILRQELVRLKGILAGDTN